MFFHNSGGSGCHVRVLSLIGINTYWLCFTSLDLPLQDTSSGGLLDHRRVDRDKRGLYLFEIRSRS
jgi:hypothetical protein